jgi:hypothetical protein
MPAAALRRVPDAQALALPEIARVIASLVMKEPL